MAKRRPALRCSANTTSGRPCGAWAIHGATVCVAHGGRAPQVKAAAARRLARQRVTAEVRRLGDHDPEHLDIGEAFADVLSQDRAEVEVYRRLVGELVPGYRGRSWVDGSDGTTIEVEPGIAGPNHLGDGAPHVLVVQYERARERLARHLKLAHEAGIEERRTNLAERYGTEITRVLGAIADWIFARVRAGDDLNTIELELPAEERRQLMAAAERMSAADRM